MKLAKLAIISISLAATPAIAEYKDGDIPKSFEAVEALTSPYNQTCYDQLESDLRCVLRDYNADKKDIFIEAYTFLSKENWESVEAITQRYLDFEYWIEASQNVENSYIVDFWESQRLNIPGKDNTKVFAHYFKYALKAPFPINKLESEATSTYTIFDKPMAGAVFSAKFSNSTWGEPWKLFTPIPEEAGVKNPNRGRGLLGQDANIHVVDIDEEYYLIIYRSRAHPKVDLLPSVSAKYMEKGIKSIIDGLFPPEL
tara:strand:+ start:188 stop:955 length:768 start_codon:yes stop_codon:yes gene_type:complete